MFARVPTSKPVQRDKAATSSAGLTIDIEPLPINYWICQNERFQQKTGKGGSSVLWLQWVKERNALRVLEDASSLQEFPVRQGELDDIQV